MRVGGDEPAELTIRCSLRGPGQWSRMLRIEWVLPGTQSAIAAAIRNVSGSIVGGRSRIDQSGHKASGSARSRVDGSVPSGRRPAPVMLR